MNFHIVTVGNPNSGKTSLFNALTGARQQVGNWSGVTVEKKSGRFEVDDCGYELIDLPGIYSLGGKDDTLDEQVASHYLQQHQPDLFLNVIDASNIERSLYLTVQLRELGLPLLVVLNKADLLHKLRLEIDVNGLSAALGCPVIALSAHNKREVNAFKSTLKNYLHQQPSVIKLDYGVEFEAIIAQLENAFAPHHLPTRGRALRLIEHDEQEAETLIPEHRGQALAQVLNLQRHTDVDLHLADSRYGFIHTIMQQNKRQLGIASAARSEQIDRILLHRWLGLPIFLLVMYLMFLFAINIGGAFIDFFDILGGALFVDGVKELLGKVAAPEWLSVILSDGVGAGLQTVATFIPIVGALFLFLSLLEGSGYLARAAFVVDALMRKLGLPGKAFVSMLMGFGCTVPAVMAARTLGSERERLLTSAMAPFMSCGARLPVYALFAVAFFPESGQNLVFMLYLIGILAAVITGLFLRSTILPGESSSFILELPDYEVPRPSYVLIKTWNKLKSFVLGAGKTIVLMITVLSLFNTLSLDGRMGVKQEESILAAASRSVTPLLSPLGIKDDNWPATIGIVTGIFAKEAVVGTLNALYTQGAEEETAEFDLLASLNEALATIPENLLGINFADPLGLELAATSDQDSAAVEQEVDVATFATMQHHFDGQAGAFAYLLLVLLYMPCAAAMGALVRETGRPWATLVALWCNYLAFMGATLYYQLATVSAHPMTTLGWVTFFALSSLLLWSLLRQRGDILRDKVIKL